MHDIQIRKRECKIIHKMYVIKSELCTKLEKNQECGLIHLLATSISEKNELNDT